jgi:hypothetical protein
LPQFSGLIGMIVALGASRVEHRIAALIVSCTSRKTVQPQPEATAVSLPLSSQRDLENAWLARLKMLPVVCPAANLYAGRGFRLAQHIADAAKSRLYIISAGLGLVAAESRIPAYGITVSGRGPESIRRRVLGRFDPVVWWQAIRASAYATPLRAVFDKEGLVLMGLTRPYAQMLAPIIADLPEVAIARLRITGVKLETFLPARLVECLLPYDERLDSIMPGTRADFAQRALSHFAREGLSACPNADASDHRNWVRAVLSGEHAPLRRQRRRLSDGEIVALIKRHPEAEGIGRMLRALRDGEGVACEQRRLSRLYRAERNGSSVP